MADGNLAIGAFAQATGLSIKALRAYHDRGVLVPARVDPLVTYDDVDDPAQFRTEIHWPFERTTP